jgi:predicted peptidase
LQGATPGTWVSTYYSGIWTYYLLPYNYNPNYSYPIFIYLHGVGGQIAAGTQLGSSGGAFDFNTPAFRNQYPAIVLLPNCEGSSFSNSWGGTTTPTANMPCENGVIAAVQDMIAKYSIDQSRIYISGHSLGAIGTDHMLMRYPNLFTAGLAASGGLFDGTTAQQFATQNAKVPYYAVHGSVDTTVSPAFDRAVNAASQAIGGDEKYTELSGLGHDIWNNVFASASSPYIAWLFAQSKK